MTHIATARGRRGKGERSKARKRRKHLAGQVARREPVRRLDTP